MLSHGSRLALASRSLRASSRRRCRPMASPFSWPGHGPGSHDGRPGQAGGRSGPWQSCCAVTRQPSKRWASDLPRRSGGFGESVCWRRSRGPPTNHRQGDPDLGRSGRGRVSARPSRRHGLPSPVSQPGSGRWRAGQYQHPVGHLVIPVRMISVVWPSEHLPCINGWLSSPRTQPVPSIAVCLARSARTAR